MPSTKKKARYLIETFEANKEEIINIINEIITKANNIEADYWMKIKKEVNRALSNEKKNINLSKNLTNCSKNLQ
jgi:gas vesicle protein